MADKDSQQQELVAVMIRGSVFINCSKKKQVNLSVAEFIVTYGPHREKTCLQGSQESEVQTSMFSYRD